jgi:hypothetical protein
MLACGWALCCGTWALYLLAFWPGIMTEDSIDQWTQAQRGVFRDEHPAVHTLLIWLITRLWNSPAAVALLQIVLVASLLALIGRDLLRLAVPRRLVAALLALAAVWAPAFLRFSDPLLPPGTRIRCCPDRHRRS